MTFVNKLTLESLTGISIHNVMYAIRLYNLVLTFKTLKLI